YVDEAVTGVEADWGKPELLLQTQADNRNVALQVRLLVGGQLDVPLLEGADHLGAGVEANGENLAGLLVNRLHILRHRAKQLAAGIDDDLGLRMAQESPRHERSEQVRVRRVGGRGHDALYQHANRFKRLRGPFLTEVAARLTPGAEHDRPFTFLQAKFLDCLHAQGRALRGKL